MKELIGDLAVQMFSPASFFFGHRLINFGLRQKDREINRKAALHKRWGIAIVNERSEEVIRKNEKSSLVENPKDLIGAIVRNSLSIENSEKVYSDESIFD